MGDAWRRRGVGVGVGVGVGSASPQLIELVLVVQAVPSTSTAITPRTPPPLSWNEEVTGMVMLSVPEPLRPDRSIEPWFDSTVAM